MAVAKNPDFDPAYWITTAITGIESEGVVSTVNGTPYRLEGPCHQPDSLKEVPSEHPFRKAIESSPKGSGSIRSVMQALSDSFHKTPFFLNLFMRNNGAATKAAASPE